MLLSLEFKLFAIRHPKSSAAASPPSTASSASAPASRSSASAHPPAHPRDPEEQLLNTLAIGGILDGLAISHLFDPDTFDHHQVVRYLKLCLRETLDDLLAL